MLFIGNSLTYYNEMPSIVRSLAEGDASAPELFVVQYTAPGWSLRRASAHEGLRDLLDDVRWDDVVMQERSDETHPFFAELDAQVDAGGGRTVIFDLGARGAGAYADAAQTLGASLAPRVWPAWQQVLSQHPDLNLYADDERHPNRSGSFLIACVFYAELTDRDPAVSDYAGDLEPELAQLLKRAAWRAHRTRS